MSEAPWATDIAHELRAREREIETLRAALDSARRIGAAIGILMATHKIHSEQAFERLSRASQDSNRKLRDIADDVIRTGALPEITRSNPRPRSDVGSSLREGSVAR